MSEWERDETRVHEKSSQVFFTPPSSSSSSSYYLFRKCCWRKKYTYTQTYFLKHNYYYYYTYFCSFSPSLSFSATIRRLNKKKNGKEATYPSIVIKRSSKTSKTLSHYDKGSCDKPCTKTNIIKSKDTKASEFFQSRLS